MFRSECVSLILGLLVASCAAAPSSASSPIASAAVTAAPPTATPAVTPVPTAVARSGLITRSLDAAVALIIRTEMDVTPIRTLPGSALVSPDGARAAYWTESAAGAAIHVVEFSGGDRIIATFPDRRAGGTAWSTDGTGILVAVAESGDPRFLIARILVAVDIASGTNREVYRGVGPSGASVVPLVWRRTPELFAAYETGPGGFNFGYTVIRPGLAPVRTEPDGRVIAMAASSDGALVSGLWLDEGHGAIKVWPVDDFSKKTELRSAADEVLANSTWWPDRREIAFLIGRLVEGRWRDRRVERWDPTTGVRTVLRALPDDSLQLGSLLVRADGTGVLTQGQAPAFAWEVTDLLTDTTAAIPQRQSESILRTVLIR